MEDTLEQWPILVAMHPMLIDTRFHLLELEAGERVKGEPEPVFSFYDEITDEQTLCCTCQIQDSDNIIYFACTNWTDGALGVRVSAL